MLLVFTTTLIDRSIVLVSYRCCNQLAHIYGPETTQIFDSFGGQESEMSFTGLKARVWQGQHSWRLERRIHFLALYQFVEAA